MATKKKLFTPSLWARFLKNITELSLRFFLLASSFCSYHGWLSRSNWLSCFHRRLVDRSLGETRLRSFLRHFGLPFLLSVPIAKSSLHQSPTDSFFSPSTLAFLPLPAGPLIHKPSAATAIVSPISSPFFKGNPIRF